MRPAIARATLRAASSLVVRTPATRAPSVSASASASASSLQSSSSSRGCSTSPLPNDPVIKHSTAVTSPTSAPDSLRHAGAAVATTAPSLADDHLRASSSSTTTTSSNTASVSSSNSSSSSSTINQTNNSSDNAVNSRSGEPMPTSTTVASSTSTSVDSPSSTVTTTASTSDPASPTTSGASMAPDSVTVPGTESLSASSSSSSSSSLPSPSSNAVSALGSVDIDIGLEKDADDEAASDSDDVSSLSSSSITSADDASSDSLKADDPSSDGNSDAAASTDPSKPQHMLPGETPSELLSQIRGYLRRNAIRSALFHFISALKVEGAPSVDKSVLKTVLPVLGRHGWAPTALEALDLALEREYNLEIGFYNCALHAMARSGDYETIQGVLNRMWTLPQESRPNATSFNYLIGSYMYRGGVDRAFDVLNDMKKHMIYPTFATYHALICGCLRSSDPRRAYTTLNAVERQRFDIGAMTVSQVMVSCADADMCDEVFNLLPRLEDALPRYALEVHRIAEKRQVYRLSPKHAFGTVGSSSTDTNSSNDSEQQQQKHKKPDLTVPEDRAQLRGNPRMELGAISAILHCALRNSRPDLAIAGWSLLKKYYPDTHIPETLWYCLIGSFAGAGDFDSAFESLGAMRENGYQPRLRDLDMILVRPLSMDISKVDEQYYRLCDKMKSAGHVDSDNNSQNPSTSAVQDGTDVATVVEVDSGDESVDASVAADGSSSVEAASETDIDGTASVTSADAASGADGKESSSTVSSDPMSQSSSSSMSIGEVLAEKPSYDDLEFVREHWSGMTAKGVGIDELNCIIAACSYAGDLDRAFQTYDEVDSVFNLDKNVETYNALLEGCIQVKHVRGGLRIVSELEQLMGTPLQGSSLQLVVRLLTRASRASDCVDLVKRVREQGGKVLLQTYLLLMRYFVRGNHMQAATELYAMGLDDGFDGRTLRARLDGEGLTKFNRALGDGDAADDGDEQQQQQRLGGGNYNNNNRGRSRRFSNGRGGGQIKGAGDLDDGGMDFVSGGGGQDHIDGKLDADLDNGNNGSLQR